MSEDFSKRPCGVIPSPPDFRDYRLYEFVDIEKEFPDNYLAPPYEKETDIPIYDQGYTSMCVAFTGALIKEQQEYKEKGAAIRMSPGWIYGNREAGQYMGEGMYPREAWAMLCKHGVPHYDEMPIIGSFAQCYTEVLKRRNDLAEKALNNRTFSYVSINRLDPDEIMTAIMKTGFINVSIAVYRDFDEAKDYLEPTTKGTLRGYHSVTAIGWKTYKSKKYLIIVNSWGKNWGKNGICYMPFNYAGIQEIWAITDLKRRVLDTPVPAQIVPPGHFMLSFRGLFEAERAEAINWWRNEKGRMEAEAILPAIGRRRVQIVEGSTDIAIEEFPE